MGRATAAARAASEDFHAVAERLAPQLYRAAKSLCGDPHDAEDVLQDTLLQAFRKWDQFEGRSDPGTWLYTIAARVCRRRHRRRAGEPTTLEPYDELLPPASGPIVDLASSTAPDRLLDHARLREAIATEIAALPPLFRVPLVLVDIAEMSTGEAARILGIKEATVKTRVHRARLRLRGALAQQLPKRALAGCEHDRRVCLDLLEAKQEALDRKVPFSMTDQALCDRCRSVYATMDLALEVCRSIGRDAEPSDTLVRQVIGRCRPQAALERESGLSPGA